MERFEKACACCLHSINGLGSRSLWNIEKQFGSFAAFLAADARLLRTSTLDEEVIAALLERRTRMDPLAYLDELERRNIHAVCHTEENYPVLLRNIHNPPFILYCSGNIQLVDRFCLALVGARKASAYGRKMARRFSHELAGKRIVIVSGMARGIDTESHLGALEAGGDTIAVLGSGLDNIYPRENLDLCHTIMEKGLVLSEFPNHTKPEPGNFPMRNRLISGLSRGVVVVEAKGKSGALITADFALEQGRDVFSVPGPVDSSTSEGTNNLIKQGAKLITGIEDIIDEYECFRCTAGDMVKQEQLGFPDGDEARILEFMGHSSVHFDELLNALGMELGLLSTLLLKMELAGIVKSLAGNYYVKI